MTIINEGHWRCTECGHEWSACMGDDEVPEVCGCEESIYDNACDDENCECRNSTLWPDNIRNGCPNKDGEEIYWSYSMPEERS